MFRKIRDFSARPDVLTTEMAVIGIAITMFPAVNWYAKVGVIVAFAALGGALIRANMAREREAREREDGRDGLQDGLQRVGIDATLRTSGESQRQIGEVKELAISHRGQLATLTERVTATQPRALTTEQRTRIERGLSPLLAWYDDRPGQESLHLHIFPMMTASDSTQFAQSIGAALRGGFTVHVRDVSDWKGDPPDISGLMLIAPPYEDDPDGNAPRLGEWVIAAFASAGITVARREKPSYHQLLLLVGHIAG